MLIEKSVLVEYSAQQMFELVDRVEDYPQFLPWCGGTSVSYRDETRIVATIEIAYHNVRQSFSTENVRRAPHGIEMHLREGPFRYLEGRWRFLPLGTDACKVEFRLHYEFSAHLIEALVRPVFGMIANTLVDAFVARAEKIYGR